MHSAEDRWFDEEAGAVVRPYALTRGRTRPTGGRLDLIALITAVRDAQSSEFGLGPEHRALLRICRRPTSVADLAADLDLPVGVIRILPGGPPARPAHPPRGRGWPSPPLSRPTTDTSCPWPSRCSSQGASGSARRPG